VTDRAKIGDLALYRRIAAELRPYWRGIAGLLLLWFAATPLGLLTPLPLKIAVDTVIGSQPVPEFLAPLLPDAASKTAMLIAAAVLLALITVLTHASALTIGFLQTFTGERLTLGFRAKLFQRAQRLSFDYHDRPRWVFMPTMGSSLPPRPRTGPAC
jgi:ATP-binding cassette, subfamily B, bacterial